MQVAFYTIPRSWTDPDYAIVKLSNGKLYLRDPQCGGRRPSLDFTTYMDTEPPHVSEKSMVLSRASTRSRL